jgi:hypothetical protein
VSCVFAPLAEYITQPVAALQHKAKPGFFDKTASTLRTVFDQSNGSSRHAAVVGSSKINNDGFDISHRDHDALLLSAGHQANELLHAFSLPQFHVRYGL